MDDKVKILVDKLRAARSILVVGHKNPDGDCLGSVLAISRLIEINFAVRPVCVYDGNIPDFLDAVPMREHISYYEKVGDAKFDLAIIVDCGALHQIGGPAEMVARAKDVLSIDHHHKDVPIAPFDLDDDRACATAEIIYRIMCAAHWQSDADVLDLIALAILTDTGNFRFARRGDALRVMAELVDSGVDLQELNDIMAARPRRAVLTEAAVASRAQFYFKDKLAIAIFERDDYKKLDGKGDITTDLLRQIRGVEYIAVLKQQRENQIGVSLRGRTRPVNEIAAALGGGGHLYAAGAVVHDRMENVRDKIVELVKGEK